MDGTIALDSAFLVFSLSVIATSYTDKNQENIQRYYWCRPGFGDDGHEDWDAPRRAQCPSRRLE